MAGVAGSDGLERGDAVGPILTDADEDAGGVRDLGAAGGFERRQAALRRLVGRAAVTREVGAQRLDHHSLAGRHGAQPDEFVLGERAGVGVG